MRKSILAMVCLAGLALLASCKKDIQPTITIISSPGYVSQDSEVYSGEEITVGFNVTGEKLTKIVISADQNGTVLYTDTEAIANESSFVYTKTFTLDATGTVTIGGTVTDAKGYTATISFNIICNEKPNAKFIGHYEGEVLISGTYDINLSNMDPINDEFTDNPIAANVDIVAGDDMNEVVATVTINDQTNTVKGTVDGSKVTFEAINDVTTMNYDYNGISIPITLEMTYNIIGNLNDNRLYLNGDCSGSGNINMFVINGTIEMEGTIGGSLIKTE